MPKIQPLIYQLVDTDKSLARIVESLLQYREIAVDLEADSMYHFEEKVCLIQIAGRKKSFLIDPLAVSDLSALKPIFSNPGILKIFHGSDYDVRSLYRDFSINIENLLDTQVAARFLGEPETGLEAMLHKRFGIQLNKRYQKKDWSARPLNSEMIEYAAADAFYLPYLAEMLVNELSDIGRLHWVQEECDLLSRVRPTTDNNTPLFLKIKGAGQLQPKELSVLEALLRFRKETARKKDRPVFKVFSNRSLLRLATVCPDSIDSLYFSKILSKKQIQMYGVTIVEIIQTAMNMPKTAFPNYPRKKVSKIDSKIPPRIKKLKLWRDIHADRMNIDPSIVLTKLQMSAIAVKNPRDIQGLQQVDEIKNWQVTEFGDEILEVLSPKSRTKNPVKKS